MPNGRSGGFCLDAPEFERLLEPLDNEAVVGKALDSSVTASEMMRALHEWKRGRVPIEEQDHSWYIVHFPDWVTVDKESPLFDSLRRAHADYLRESIGERQEGDKTV